MVAAEEAEEGEMVAEEGEEISATIRDGLAAGGAGASVGRERGARAWARRRRRTRRCHHATCLFSFIFLLTPRRGVLALNLEVY